MKKSICYLIQSSNVIQSKQTDAAMCFPNVQNVSEQGTQTLMLSVTSAPK